MFGATFAHSPTYFCILLIEQKYDLALERGVWETIHLISSSWLGRIQLPKTQIFSISSIIIVSNWLCIICLMPSIQVVSNDLEVILDSSLSFTPYIYPITCLVSSKYIQQYILNLSTSLCLYCHHTCHIISHHHLSVLLQTPSNVPPGFS